MTRPRDPGVFDSAIGPPIRSLSVLKIRHLVRSSKLCLVKVQVKEALFVERFVMSCISLRRSGMALVKEESRSFTCHPHVYPQVK